MSFFEELKRRNVLRVAFAYVVVAWLLLQVSDTLVPALRLPEWFHSGVAFLLILGFPIALIFAWAFELTPDGLKKDVGGESGNADTNRRKLNFVIIGLLVVALGYLGYDKLVLDPQRDAALVESTKLAEVEAVAVDSPSIAVLAFANMSDDVGNEYFSEGLSEELLNLLAKIPELHVAARTSSFSYKGKDTKAHQIGLELNVAQVLEGSVRKSGDRIRITAQLIKASDGFHVWSKTFDRTLEDIFAIQDEIAAAIVSELKVNLLGTMPEGRTTDPEVYSLYLQGHYFNRLNGAGVLEKEKAIVAFKEAVAIDPNYAPAWVGLQLSYTLAERNGLRSKEESRALALDAVERALAIDESLASAWAGLAFMRRTNDWDWQGASVAINRALELEPNNPEVLPAAASIAGTFGRLDESIALFERNTAVDPLKQASYRALGSRYLNAGRFEDALRAFRKVQTLNPEYPGIRNDFIRTYLLSGDPERALLELNALPDGSRALGLRVATHSELGNEAEAQAIMNDLLEMFADDHPGVSANFMAATYGFLGENDSAFEWLEKAYQRREYGLVYFLGNLWFRKLVTDPRYAAFVEKLGLLDEWKAMPPEYGGPRK
jgi:adenylate cyclase